MASFVCAGMASWSLIANLSAFQASHPVANPDEEDFEPDGTWYSMIAAGGALYPMDSNHGELDRVTPDGAISRVIDISASVGHVVPTALAQRGRERGRDGDHGDLVSRRAWDWGRPALFISNLGVFDPTDGAGDEHVYDSPGAGRSRFAPPGSRRSSASPSAAASCTRLR